MILKSQKGTQRLTEIAHLYNFIALRVDLNLLYGKLYTSVGVIACEDLTECPTTEQLTFHPISWGEGAYKCFKQQQQLFKALNNVYSIMSILVHSFIMRITIVRLQGDYSGACPLPARLKRTVLGEHKKRVREDPTEQAQCQRYPHSRVMGQPLRRHLLFRQKGR